MAGITRQVLDYFGNIFAPYQEKATNSIQKNQNVQKLETGRRNLGPASITQPQTIYSAKPSSIASQPQKPSPTGKTKAEFEPENAKYEEDLERWEKANQGHKSAVRGRQNQYKTQYEDVMGTIADEANAEPQYVYENIFDVFSPWDEKGNPRKPGPHLSNIAWTQRLVSDEQGKELADKYNEDLSSDLKEEAGAKEKDTSSEAEASPEIDMTETIIDPNTGEEISLADLTLAGHSIAADDYAGIASAKYLYEHPELYSKYGDDWSEFQRNGTYKEWQDLLNAELNPEMAQYFAYITGDKQFRDETTGKFDFDTYWQHAIGLDPMDVANLSDADRMMIYGDSAAAAQAMNDWRASMMENSPEAYALMLDPDYDDQYGDFVDQYAQSGAIFLDADNNAYFGGFGDGGLSHDQLVSLLNMQTMQDISMLPMYGGNAYTLNELNSLSEDPGWNTVYGEEEAAGSSNDYGMPEGWADNANYNPYAVNAAQLAYMLGMSDQVYDPTGYVMNAYSPRGLYYTRN